MDFDWLKSLPLHHLPWQLMWLCLNCFKTVFFTCLYIVEYFINVVVAHFMAVYTANVTEGASAVRFPFGEVSASKISPTFREFR